MKKNVNFALFCYSVFILINYVCTCLNSPTTNCTCGVTTYGPDAAGRIRGGEVVDESQLPWMATLFSGDELIGGATLINDLYLLTAAQVFLANDPRTGIRRHNYTKNTITIYLGTTTANYEELQTKPQGLDIVTMEEVLLHPNYDPGRIGVNDIALVKRRSQLKSYTAKINPICLPPAYLAFENETGQAAGWGSYQSGYQHSSSLLIASAVQIWKNSDCRARFENDFNSTMSICGLHHRRIPCDKDIGGPLVFRKKSKEYIQIGIIIYTRTCELNYGPTMYTRVNSYLEWIIENSREGYFCQRKGPDQKALTRDCICGLALESRSRESETNVGRIAGGNPAADSEFPWVVGVGYYHLIEHYFLGSGTLINDHYVLTTASTMFSRNDVTGALEVDNRGGQNYVFVIIGSNDFPTKVTAPAPALTVYIEQFIYHPKYDGYIRFGYDIMLLKLKVPLRKYTNKILPICLPEIISSFEGIESTVVSFGNRGPKDAFTSYLPNALFKTKMKVRLNTKCSTDDYGFLPDQFLCSSGFAADTCQSDAGAPQLYKANRYQYIQIGLSSWGYACGTRRFMSIAVRVTAHLDWIKNETRDGFYCENELP